MQLAARPVQTLTWVYGSVPLPTPVVVDVAWRRANRGETRGLSVFGRFVVCSRGSFWSRIGVSIRNTSIGGSVGVGAATAVDILAGRVAGLWSSLAHLR